MISQFGSKQFLKFLVVGGLAAIVNFSSRVVYSFYVHFPVAVAFAYLTGMIVAYVLSRFFVFHGSKQSLQSSLLLFTFVNLIALLQTFLITMIFAYLIFPYIGFVWYSHSVAHAIGICFPVFTSYLGHKHLTFRM